MAKRKTPKVKDLKPTSITEEQLKAIQEIVSPINNMQMEIGRVESRKHMLMHEVAALQGQLQEQQQKLEEEYGKVNINIQTGEINYDVETNS